MAPGAGAGMAGPGDVGAGAGIGAAPAATGAAAAGGGPAGFVAGTGGTLGGGGGYLNMLGDQGPLSIRQTPGFPPNQPPGLPDPRTRSLLNPSVRGFKIAENQSPIPQDRVFYSFNYFEDVNKKLNDFFESPIDNLVVYRHVAGLEKTFNEGQGSIGVRVPLNTIKADSREPSLPTGGYATALGDLTVFAKYILEQDPRTGSLATAGLAITPPTGPGTFANAPFLRQLGPNRIHNTTIQPFFAYLLNFADGDLFVHGFTSLDTPVDPRDVTILYNDIGLGYYLHRATTDERFLTAVVPTVEAHLTTPLNHREEYNLFDQAGTPDVLNITAGIHFEFNRQAVLTFGFVTPVTGPKPFDFETLLLLNIRFGGRRAGQAIVPMVGG